MSLIRRGDPLVPKTLTEAMRLRQARRIQRRMEAPKPKIIPSQVQETVESLAPVLPPPKKGSRRWTP